VVSAADPHGRNLGFLDPDWRIVTLNKLNIVKVYSLSSILWLLL
jgi:hypothetical protein